MNWEKDDPEMKNDAYLQDSSSACVVLEKRTQLSKCRVFYDKQALKS